MSAQYGLTLHEFLGKMPARELAIRLTHAMVEKGYTFDREKIAKIQKSKRDQEVEEFMNKARKHWSRGG